ncbi:hypothetical protein HDE_08251 [Halotydeus destructor]|nr:hypothetical protein HDE_08251 [Halotydeus destructor]
MKYLVSLTMVIMLKLKRKSVISMMTSLNHGLSAGSKIKIDRISLAFLIFYASTSMYSTGLEMSYITKYGIKTYLKMRLVSVDISIFEKIHLWSVFVYFDPFIARQSVIVGGATCVTVLYAIYQLDRKFMHRILTSRLTSVGSYRKATYVKVYTNKMKRDFNDIFSLLPTMWLLSVFIKLSGQIIRLRREKNQTFPIWGYFLYELSLSVIFIALLVHIDEKLESNSYTMELTLIQSPTRDPSLIVAQEQLIRMLRESNPLSAMTQFDIDRQLSLNFISALIDITLLLLQISAAF